MNLLVNPRQMIQLGYTPPPLGLLYLAAMDDETVIADCALSNADPRPVITAWKPEVVGVPIYTPRRHDALSTLKIAKDLGAITVAGGPHVDVMPEAHREHYPFVDHWVEGDGEIAWRVICDRSLFPGQGRVMRLPIPQLDDLPIPAWQRTDISLYPARPSTATIHRGNDLTRLPRVSIVFGRGCSGSCTFCSTWWVHGHYRHHSVDWMLAELDLLWELGARHLVFQDDCLTADRDASLALFQAMATRYMFSWMGTTRVDTIDDELALVARDAGCYELSFGIENGSPEILKRMHKRANLEQAFAAREVCRRAGIYFTALYIDGFPGETAQTRAEDQEFRRRLMPDSAGGLGHTMVLPGTAIYQQCKRAGLIDDDFWLGPEPYYVYRGGL